MTQHFHWFYQDSGKWNRNVAKSTILASPRT